MLARSLVIFAGLSSLLLATEEMADPWRYIDPGAKVIVGVQWRKLFDSPAGRHFRQQFEEGLALPGLPGAEILNGIDTVLFSSPGATSAVIGKAPAQPSILIAVSGDFDLTAIRSAVNKRSKRAVVQGIELFEGGSKMSLALVSPGMLLLGDTPNIVRAIGATRVRQSLMLTRAHELHERNDFWAVTSIPPTEAAGLSLPLPVSLDDARTLEFGLNVSEGIGFDLNLQMRSTDAARKLRAELTKTLQLAAKDKGLPSDLAGLDKYLKLSADREFVRMAFRLDAAGLEKRLAAYDIRSRAQRAHALAAPTPPPVAAPPVNAKPVIWNLDPQP